MCDAFRERVLLRLDVEILAVNVARTNPVWLPGGVGTGWVVPWPGPESAEFARATSRAVDDAQQTLERSPLREDEAIIEFGDPADAICEAAQERHVDLVVVGSNHKNVFERLLSPSVSQGVLKEADRPVLVVP